jgi:hypothetical protein
MPLSIAYLKLLFLALWDALKQVLGGTPSYIPAVGRPGTVGALTAHGSVEGMFKLGGCVLTL